MNLLQSKLELPCGATIKNRIAKSAMTERIADSGNVVSKKHLNLYSRWAESECGLLISGNICLLYTSPSPRDVEESRMPSSA